MNPKRVRGKIDWMITLVPLAIVVALCILFFLVPEQSNAVLSQIRFFFGDTFGTYYLVIGLGIFILSLYIACSKYGDIVLGEPNEKPQYSFFAWGSMMFTCGLAAGYPVLLFFGMGAVCNRPPSGRDGQHSGLGRGISLVPLELYPVGLLFGAGGSIRLYAARKKKNPPEILGSLPPDSGQAHRWLGRSRH